MCQDTITERMLYPICKGKIPFYFPHFQQERSAVSSEVCLGKMQRQHPDSKQMLSISNHSLSIQRDLHLISSSRIYASRSIKRSHFPIRNWLSLFVVFSSSSLNTSGMSLQTLIMRSLFLNEMRFHICKCNIKERGLYRSFSVMLDYF